ncbi:ribokinase [Halomonas campisalis]|uniref:Ribokinase n=1 Tax=Billgrantia campisalis TaxID=74661 RepID=A0ABS9P5N2_9GAMM|nr:ribokinase [Halomonas campisalis]MCG6657087.1 ribokinase [Halomonas campisalis]MDR5862272.1 ribokinase [Halomonas campisalis]
MLYNFGSINLDHFYRVPHLVHPGETLTSRTYRVGLGGKGANQSLAMALAGGRVTHWGRLGRQDGWAKETLSRAGVDVSRLELVDEPSGHAIIQVDDRGENAIILHPGANHGFKTATLAQLIETARPGEWLLAQNECNGLPELMEHARSRGLNIAFNPAPMTDAVQTLPLDACRLLFVNRGEAARLAEVDEATDAQSLLTTLAQRLPETATVLTLGGEGAWYQHDEERFYQPAIPVRPVDTTGAGDTFIGYFLATLQTGASVPACLERAAMAAALGVQQPGAAESIPASEAVDRALRDGLPA